MHEMTDDEVVRKAWPDWELTERIGGGANGVVYKAVRREYGVEVYSAIKIITIPVNASEADSVRSSGMSIDAARTYFRGTVSRCIGEIKIMESLKGAPNVVSIEDFKAIEDPDVLRWYILIRMELLTPMHVYTCDRKLSEKDVLRLGIEMCTALEACMKKDTIHRDIKPENILVSDYGNFKLGDFGIAREIDGLAVTLSLRSGTPLFMAPEVFAYSYYDQRADIYSLGLVLYYYMNRYKAPFISIDKQIVTPRDRDEAVKRRNARETIPTPIDASPAFAEVILRACEYDPDRRFQNAIEMKRALMRVRDEGAEWEGYDEPLRSAVQPPPATQPPAPIRVSLKKSDDSGAAQKPTSVFTARPASAQPAARPAAAQPAAGPATAQPAARPATAQPAALPASAQPAARPAAAQPAARTAHTQKAVNTKTRQVVNTFGDDKSYKRARRTLGIFIAIVLLCAAAIIVYTIISVNGRKNSAPNSSSDMAVASVSDEAPADTADDSPETAAAAGESDGETAKAQVLRRAEALADKGEYAFAKALIEDAQREAPDDADYAEAWVRYSALVGAESVPEQTAPVTQTTKPTAQTTKPTAQTTKPTAQTTKPTAQTSTTVRTTATTPGTTVPEPVVLRSISVRTPPDKTEYYAGEALDTDGLTLTAEYSDGTQKTITYGYSCEEIRNTQGAQTLEVEYGGQTAYFIVYITPVEPREIEWYGVSAGSTYDSAGELTGFLLQCMFRCDSHSESGYSAYDSIGLEKGHSVFYVESYDYMYFSFWLPDDPSLEGWHTVTLCHDGVEDSVDYYLEYTGDYSDIIGTSQSCAGLGWEVTEWYAA